MKIDVHVLIFFQQMAWALVRCNFLWFQYKCDHFSFRHKDTFPCFISGRQWKVPFFIDRFVSDRDGGEDLH